MQLKIKNFRAIKEQNIKLAPITVVYGPNGAGKSSLIYALLTLKTAILNSNSATSGFFNYGFTSLGGFEAVVFDHRTSNKIELSLRLERNGEFFEHGLSFGETEGTYKFSGSHGVFNFNTELRVTFPYPANQTVNITDTAAGVTASYTWNGITAQLSAGQQVSPESSEAVNRALLSVNSPVELLRKVNMIPLRRGFSKPFYQSQPLSALLITEEEVATLLSTNKYLVSRVSFYLEQVLGRDFRVNFQPGTAIFSLDATDKKTGIASELVNEGFGVNQMVYFFAKTLSQETLWACVEEPEIHLHPSAVRGLARALGDIVNVEGKNFVISSHSEAFVLALLSLVSEGKLKAEQLAFYFVQKEGRRAEFERQIVRDDGQLEGGLSSFMGGELEDLKSMLRVKQ